MAINDGYRYHDLDNISLTASQGFSAVTLFLKGFYDRTKGGGRLGSLLDDMELESDGRTTDGAALGDWLNSVLAVLNSDRSPTDAIDPSPRKPGTE